MKKDRKDWPLWKDLLLIPIQLIADIALLYLGAFLDSRTPRPDDAIGHPFFAFTVLFSFIALAASVAVLIYVAFRVMRKVLSR